MQQSSAGNWKLFCSRRREESQQLAMEQVEEEFERRMSESQRALEERAEAASLRRKMLAQQESGVRRRQKKPRWVKVVFENYRPNRWFTEEQMSSDQRGRGSDARRVGAEGMGRRD
ncbi:hypothetical protein SKAU_G00131070 [Synaphobranchus kaupii]|uniref:Uncharacterized protein n=1 Tax=Synaphobranchus kaupii TaxID=118154 RepID=A0A9Q1FQY5_SYNKA|nr:hypothetical protein SKAU_G00131070 [Synaphobranchus kaupii]